MFGSDYAPHLEVLTQSFSAMNERYGKRTRANPLSGFFQSIYVRMFGIPEIGFQIRFLYFRNALNTLSPKNILDVGCGIGAYTFYLAKMYPKAQVDGWDIIKPPNYFGLQNVSFSYRDITKPVNKYNRYDFIVMIDVLEHIKDYRKVIRNMHGLLCKNGYIFIHTPLINQKRIFKEFETWEHQDHVREGFEEKKLISELKKIGFRIIQVRRTFGFFGSLAWELNHMLLARGWILSGLLYPALYVLAKIDLMIINKRGLGIAILAKKI